MKEFQKHFQIQPFAGIEAGEILEEARTVFEKRHPITHNLGVIDRKYLERVRSGELEGREVRITPWEVEQAIELAGRFFGGSTQRYLNFHRRRFRCSAR